MLTIFTKVVVIAGFYLGCTGTVIGYYGTTYSISINTCPGHRGLHLDAWIEQSKLKVIK